MFTKRLLLRLPFVPLLSFLLLTGLPANSLAEGGGPKVSSTQEKQKKDEIARALVIMHARSPQRFKAVSGSAEMIAGTYVVAEVSMKDTPTVTVAEGLPVRTSKGWYSLQMRYNVSSRKNKFGRVDDIWGDLHAAPLGSEETTVIASTVSDIPLPEDEPAVAPFYHVGDVQIVAIFEDHVSLRVYGNGFAGGAHEYDDVRMTFVSPFQMGQVDLKGMLKDQFEKTIKSFIETKNKTEGREDESAIPSNPEDFWSNGALELDLKQGSLNYASVIFCCTWAENHNMEPVSVPLRPHTGILEKLFPFKFLTRGIVVLPDGSTVGLVEGKLQVAKGGKAFPLDIPGYAINDIIGIYWLKPGESLDIKKLLPPVLDTRKKRSGK